MHGLPFKGIQVSTRRADKRWLRRSLVASRGSWGSALPWISKVADRGLVWPLLGGALAARRSTRSAGAAGIAAVVVTSAVTWAIQQAVRRDRPPTLTALVTRGSARRPAASSFPSTHAANAFAFAAAAGTICPGLSVVLVPLAAAIGVARVGIAHHYPADVVAGALTGAGIGTAIGLFVRRRYPRSSPPESPLSPLPRTGLSVADPRGRDPRPPAAYDERTDKDRTRLDAG